MPAQISVEDRGSGVTDAGSLQAYFLPDSVIATKPSSGAGEWFRGDDRSLEHNHWLLQTDDPKKKRFDSKHAVAFDSFVDFGGVGLSAEERRHDQLTMKIACLTFLSEGGASGRNCGAGYISAIMDSFTWFLRWRLSRGIQRNSDLTNHHVEDYLSLLASGSVLGLVPVFERMEALQALIDQGVWELALTKPANAPAGKFSIDWHALAAQLGVSRASLSTSTEFRAELIDRLEFLAPSRTDIQVRCLTPASDTDAKRGGGAVIDGLITLDALWRLSSRKIIEHDPIGFDPLGGSSTKAVMKKLATKLKAPSRTGTLLPVNFLRVLDVAFRWVMDYGEFIVDAVERSQRVLSCADKANRISLRQELADQLADERPPGLPAIWPDWFNTGQCGASDAILLTTAVRHLMTACLIVVGGMCGRRLNEVTSLRPGCIVERKQGILELTIYIEKTLRDLDLVPAPAIVQVAVSLLDRLTAITNADTTNRWLFEISIPGDMSRIVRLRPGEDINALLEISGVEPPTGQSKWEVRSHQLRRGFAIAYYHGFRYSSLDALSRQLRHFDPEMTRIYINEATAGLIGSLREQIDARSITGSKSLSREDKQWITDAKNLLADLRDRSAAFNEVRCEALVERMLQMWDGAEKPVGKGAERLYGDLSAMVNKASAVVRIGARGNNPEAIREPLTSLLQDYARTHYLEPVPGGAAHCTCRPDHEEDLAQAVCLKASAEHRAPWGISAGPPAGIGKGPDFSFSGAYVCLNCNHCAAFSENQLVIEQKEARLEAAAGLGASDASRTAAAAKLQQFKAAIAAAKQATKGRA